METFTDKTINLFFSDLGGTDFLGLAFGSIIIIAILIAITRPFNS